ncbi:MAG: thioredoxin domain-containing protein [Planctomycetes bacterium]|nr:thioredoxin domain-containing protein [Planctomycetota bacterium]
MALWSDWSDEAFRRARERGCPVLLFVRASWCRWCRELETLVLADPRVERVLNERFVCVKVDKDRRPDIDVRYSKGGWPTLAWLDDEAELLASDTYLEIDELLQRLELVADYYSKNRDFVRARIAEVERDRRAESARASGRGKLSLDIVEHVARTIVDTADPVHGGWGREHKFPQTEAIDFALIRWSQTGDNSMLQLVTRTLRAMQAGEIHDTVEGGFYRYATQADWSVPHHEKMLDSNAQRLFAYLEAWQVLGDESFRATARGILSFLYETLLDERTGAFKGSQDANPTYAHLTTRAARKEFGAPACDSTIFTNWNAITVSALLKAAAVLGEPRHAEAAFKTLEFLCEEMFDDQRGVYHYWDGSYHLPGMLADHAYLMRALIDASQHAGDMRYLVEARKIADMSIEQLHSPSGGFYDMVYDPGARGGLRQRNRSILENSVMAEALFRLSALLRIDDYADTARDALASFADDYKRFGHFTAGYARAVDLLFHLPIHVTIVGPRASQLALDLQRAALKPYVASRIVQILDPSEDASLLERSGLPQPRAGEPARAYVARGRESYAETADPSRLAALMTRVERGD